MQRGYPSSENLETYRFLQNLADIRARLGDIEEKPLDVFTALEQFLETYRKDPLLKQYAPDLAQSLAQLIHRFAEKPVELGSLEVVVRGERLVNDMQRLGKDVFPGITARNLINVAHQDFARRQCVGLAAMFALLTRGLDAIQVLLRGRNVIAKSVGQQLVALLP